MNVDHQFRILSGNYRDYVTPRSIKEKTNICSIIRQASLTFMENMNAICQINFGTFPCEFVSQRLDFDQIDPDEPSSMRCFNTTYSQL